MAQVLGHSWLSSKGSKVRVVYLTKMAEKGPQKWNELSNGVGEVPIAKDKKHFQDCL